VTTLRLANGMAKPSVVSVTCVHPTQGVQLFRDIFAPYCSLAIRQLTHQKSRRLSKGITPNRGIKCKGVGKSCNFRPISRYSS